MARKKTTKTTKSSSTSKASRTSKKPKVTDLGEPDGGLDDDEEDEDLEEDEEPDEDEDEDEDEAPPRRAAKTAKKSAKLKRFKVVAVRQGYDGVQRRREGKAFVATARSEEDLPSWVMLESDYKRKLRDEELEEADSNLGSVDDEI